MSKRTWVFVLIVLASLVGAAGYAAHVVARARAEAAAAPAVTALELAALPPAGRPYVLYRNTALGAIYGRIGLAYLDAKEPLGTEAQRYVSPLQCDRVHLAAGLGICLEARRGALTTYHAHVFDDKFQIRHSYALLGIPSRARMSPDGRLAAFTVFVSGHAYSSPGFSTVTSVVDTASGEYLIPDLEKLDVSNADGPFKANDFNFWGFTFARDMRRFYATLGTAGKTFLVEGDLETRRMRVLHDDVECPSLSPDNTRIAFKRRIASDQPGRFHWRLHVLDLASAKVTALDKEIRSVDDQVEWLNEREIVYAMPKDDTQSGVETHVWALAADAATAPRLLLTTAFSPAVAR